MAAIAVGMLWVFLSFGGKLLAESVVSEEVVVTMEGSAEEEALDLKASPLAEGSFLTDTFLMGWIVSLGLIFVVRVLLWKPNIIPSRGQALIESIIEGLEETLASILGKHALSYAFPALLGYFFFLLIQNWSGLFPGVGSIGFQENGHFFPVLRPMNSDLNATLGIALVSMILWAYCVLKCVGLQGFCEHVFGNKAERVGLAFGIYQLLIVVFLAVGCIECISIAFRAISLSFRLFGNVFGGETLLHHMYDFGKFLTSGGFAQTELYRVLAGVSSVMARRVDIFLSWAGYLLPLPFYFLECLIGLIQAFVFTLLVAVYIGLICHHEDEAVPMIPATEVQS
jgi:F-type H+-transporting ATPase subunit a